MLGSVLESFLSAGIGAKQAGCVPSSASVSIPGSIPGSVLENILGGVLGSVLAGYLGAS